MRARHYVVSYLWEAAAFGGLLEIETARLELESLFQRKETDIDVVREP